MVDMRHAAVLWGELDASPALRRAGAAACAGLSAAVAFQLRMRAASLIAFVERYHNPERILSLCSSSTAYKGMRLDLHQYTSLEVCDCASLSASQRLSM